MKPLEKIREDIIRETTEGPISYILNIKFNSALVGFGLGLIIGGTSVVYLMSQSYNPPQPNYKEVRTSDPLPQNILPNNLPNKKDSNLTSLDDL
ncbi:hypothetical protein CMI38_03340 [Candidatus Pacearchaeota archaeon]|nr:hypothetical protein [Candidatus Pacearchaeota archaeon]|tara:strand:+ start:63 stop:344 length:282 start_codon:yes stop_codon:yes gene_type:complete